MALDLSDIGEISRVTLHPGDGLVVHLTADVDQATGDRIQAMVRRSLRLSDDVGVLVLAPGVKLEVIAEP
jgi:hypothetical protein